MSEHAEERDCEPAYSPQEVARVISSRYPKLVVTSIRFCGQGSDFCSYAVNEQYLFRFGIDDESAERLNWERRLLPELKSQLSIAVPDFQHIDILGNGRPLVIYPMIHGEPFSSDLYDRLSPSGRRRIAAQLADFLMKLHAFPVERAAAFGIRERRQQEECRRFREQARERIYPRASEQERTACEAWFSAYFGDAALHAYMPALIHGDLQSRHLLVDVANERLSGVIDFSDIWIGDPDCDLHYLLDDYGEALLHDVLCSYPHESPTRLLWKSKLFRLCGHIDEVVFCAEDGRPKDAERAWRALSEFLAMNAPSPTVPM